MLALIVGSVLILLVIAIIARNPSNDPRKWDR